MFKFKYRVHRLWKIILRDTFAPFFDKTQFFYLLTIPIFLLLSFDAQDFSNEIGGISKTSLAIILTLPFWFAINVILSPFKLVKEEKNLGYWKENQFIYNTPIHVITLFIRPEDHSKNIRFRVFEAPPNSFVFLKIDYQGGLAGIDLKLHECSAPFRILVSSPSDPEHKRIARQSGLVGIRLNNKSETVAEINCPQNSTETVATISAFYWQE